MKRVFPQMHNRPDAKSIVLGAVCFPVFLIALQSLVMPVLTFDHYSVDQKQLMWASTGIYTVCFVVILFGFYGYLAEARMNVRMYWREFLAAVAIATGVLVTVMLLIWGLGSAFSIPAIEDNFFYVFPLAEYPMMRPAGLVLDQSLVLGLVYLIVLAPVTVCCLYYGVFFAPVCVKRPWLAYLLVALVAAFPRVVGLIAIGYPDHQTMLYILQLPWHLICCWAYQKADSIWAPICVYSLVNVIGCVLWPIFHSAM